jgi:hypothetical protein
MKPNLLALLLPGLLCGLLTIPGAQAQLAVVDGPLLQQTIANTYLAHRSLDVDRGIERNTDETARRLGDAGRVGQLAGAANVLQSLSPATTGPSPAGVPGTGLDAMTYDGNKLFRTIGSCITAPDGSTVNRNGESYRKFEAAHQTAANYLAVLKDTETRRQAVLDGLKATTEAVQQAPDLATVQKLQAVVTAQVAALNAIDGERMAALGGALVQSLDNNTDDAKQEQARKEDRGVDFQTASTQFARFLTPLSARASTTRAASSRR